MFKSTHDLCQFLQLDPTQLRLENTPAFPVKVPLHYAEQMEKGNPNDPLLKQVLPVEIKQPSQAFSLDPVGDLQKNPTPSLIHKYQGRALLMTSSRCDIHCRYCFRQHFPYEQVKQQHWLEALNLIEQDKSINEVILSGGDPFTLSEKALLDLIHKIEAIRHIKILRIHSRTPISAPDQSPQNGFIEWLQQTRLKVVLVTHCNHVKELSQNTQKLMLRYLHAGCTLLNQSVLLKDINDSVDTLEALSHGLFEQGILPYYCHLLDKVSGAENFEVDRNTASVIFDELRKRLPGYLVPQLVEEIAGAPYKKVINTLHD